MSQITHGVRAMLSYSNIYDLFQRLMGSRNGRGVVSSRYIRANSGDHVLDIGCGTAEIRDFLPAVKYWGFDPNIRYIKAAKSRLSAVSDCNFFCATVDETVLKTLPKFDIALALGVLHHLDDEEGIRLATLAKTALKKNGRLILIDPCFAEGQSLIARFFAMHDRGQHVRDLSGYLNLMKTVFGIIRTEIRHDLIKFPYTHLIMECIAE